MNRYVRTAVAAPATAAASAALAGDGLSPATRFATAARRTPDIGCQLAVLVFRVLDEPDGERFDDVRPFPLLLLELPLLREAPADRVALGFEGARLRTDDDVDRPEDDELDSPEDDELDSPEDDELDPPCGSAAAPRDLLSIFPPSALCAWRLKRSARARWSSSSWSSSSWSSSSWSWSSSSSAADADSLISSMSE